MPLWGLYSVLLKRAPRELRGMGLAFTLAAFGVAMLLPLYAGFLWCLHAAATEGAGEGGAGFGVTLRRSVPALLIGTGVFAVAIVGFFVLMAR
jgi:hypothetical protein